MRIMTTLVITTVAVLGLTGCAGIPVPTATETVEVTVEAEPELPTDEIADEDLGYDGGFSEQEAAVWAYEQVMIMLPDEITPTMCIGYGIDPDYIVDSYVEGFTGSPLSDGTYVDDWIPMDRIEADAARIFAEVCGV